MVLNCKKFAWCSSTQMATKPNLLPQATSGELQLRKPPLVENRNITRGAFLITGAFLSKNTPNFSAPAAGYRANLCIYTPFGADWSVPPPEAGNFELFCCSQSDVLLKNDHFQRETAPENPQNFLLTQNHVTGTKKAPC